MQRFITDEELEYLKKEYPLGCRVELVSMDDPYATKPQPGDQGTVNHIDDTGTIFVSWDCGSGLGVVWGEDEIKKV